MKFTLKLMLTVFLALSVQSAMAKGKKGHKAEAGPLKTPHIYGQIDLPTPMTPEEMAKAKKDIKTANRGVADTIDEETALTEDMKNFRNEIIGGVIYENNQKTNKTFPGIKSKEDLDKFLNKIDKDYATYTPDVQILVAQLVPMRAFKSIIYRAQELVGAFSVSRSMVVTTLRMIAAGMNNYTDGMTQWQAAFSYMTEPMAGLGNRLDTEPGVQNFLRLEVEPEMKTLRARIEKLRFDKPVYFDNKIFLATLNFADDNDRFIRFGEAERHALLASIYATQASLYMTCAYDLSGMFQTMNDVGQIYGFDALDFKVDGATAKARNAKITTHSKLFTLIKYNNSTEVSISYTKAAYSYLKVSLQQTELAWDELQKNSNNAQFFNNILDPRAFMPFQRTINASLDNMKSLMSGAGIKSAMINGKPVEVDFEGFFSHPPEDLKLFLPVSYDEGPSTKTDPATGKSYRNYLQGSPIGWRVGEYQKYFPNVNDSGDIKDAARVMSQSWGGWAVSLPFLMVSM